MDMRIRDVDPDLSRKFRAYCQYQGRTLGDMLMELMRERLKQAGFDKLRSP
jgi:hypothetical protein